uniref:YSIRK-type signal peptide-containing protein n=1 Tax=Streptococcus mitis TaxID=28037 RepID=UPI00066E00D0
MFGKKRDDNGEKVYRYSIRKYHFGAASVAIAALIFFANGVAKADMAVSPATANSTHQTAAGGGGDSSGDSGSAGDPNDQATTTNSTSEVTTPTRAGISTGTTSVENPVVSDSSNHSENVESTTSNVSEKTEIPTVTTGKAQGDVTSTEAKKVNVTDLKTALEELESKVASITDEAKKAKLNAVIAEAKKVLEDKNATQEQIDSQVTLVKDAVKSVQEVAKKGDETKPSEENRSATVEAPNREITTPARSPRGRRGRNTDVQPKSAGGSNLEAETAPKALPTYTNGTDNYALAEEMRKIVKYLQDNGADVAKVASIKDNYDKLNEKLGLTDENAVLSEADFAAATANLKAARDFTEGFLRKQDENGQPLNEQPTVPETERSVGDESRRTERSAGQPRYIKRDSSRDSKAHYNVAKEYYYEDGTKGSSPYDKYTYLFHTFTESLVANNANHSPVRDIKRLVYEEVTEVNGGYLWNITFNAAHEDQQDGYAFFSIPKGQRVENSSINVVKTAQNGNEAEVDGSGDLLSRLKMIHPNSTLTGKEIVVRRNGGAEEESLQGLATSSAYAGYYTRRLETANNEIEKSNNMFEKIMSATEGGGKVYRFQLHGRDSYTISFKTINENRTRMDKLYYAAGYRVQQWGRRILAEQWHGRHDYDQDDTDRFPLHVVGNGTFLIKQGKHYNTAYPQGAYGFGGRDYDYNPFRADGILGYDASGAYNSNFDMHQYTAPEGSDTPSSNTKATTAGQKFEFYDKEGNKLSASQIGMHGADKPGLVEYKVKRTFTDKSSDFLNIKFAIQPKTPTFTENIANSRGQTKNLTVSNGTNGYPITLFREYMENGAKKIEKVATVNANSGGNAVFNNVLIKSGKYYAQSIIPTAAYYDYDNRKHTDVHSDKSTEQEVLADGMAPTIQVGESGKPLATTPANNQVTLFVTPNNKGEVSLDVQIKDDELGDGMNAFSSGTNGNAKYSITGDHNSGATAFTAKGGVTGGKTVNALLKVKLNGTTIPNGGLTVKLNAKDKAGNWTDTATPAKTLTVKLLSAVPNEPAVRMITGNDVQNGAIKTDVKNQVLESVKNANPDLVKAGVKFEYDTTAGNTDKIKVTYPDGQTRLLTPTKGTKPTAPVVVGPQDGTVSITPQGDTDKVTFQYVPTNQTNLKEIIAKKDGNSWAIQGTRPDGITVDSRTGKITITEPTVKDQSPVTATATFLNSDTSDTARDTAKNPDRQAPEVWMNGKKLTETATDNKFLIYRGATFNPTFRVEDNSGTTDTFMIKNIPNGVWFNKQGNRDVAHTGVANGREITFSNQVVAPETPLGTREAIVSVRDKNGNAAEYKFQYIIADVLLKNSPKSVATGSKLGDSHQFVASTLNGTTSNDDVYFPGNMKFLWANNETENTTLPNSAQTVTKEAIVEFPYTALNGKTTANGITIYAPKQIKKNVTFNLADNEKPQATLNGISIGQTAGDPIFTVFRGANFNPQLEAWDNSGKITNVTISGLPTNATATPFPGGVQTGSESHKYTARLFSGVVPANQDLGEYEATLTVQGDGPKDTSVLKFKYRVVDMDFKNGYETADTGQATGKSYVIGLRNGQSLNLAHGDKNINPKDYWKVIDEANKTDRGYAYLPEGVSYRSENKVISSNPADKSKGASVAMGHYGVKLYVDFTRAGEGDKVGDIANENSTSRTVFTPRTIERRLLVAVDPSAPTIDGGEDLLYGKAGEKPDIKVKDIVNIGESTADVGTVNKNAIRTIQLYSDSDPNTPIAEHAFAQGSRETEYTFRASDYATSRPNGLLADETIYSRVKVTHRGVSTLSGNSNEKEVTAKLDVRENATNRIIQANDQKLNDAEKTGIRIALRNANPTLNLSDENIEISDSGAIVITKDKKRAWLQTNPNKKDGNTTTGFITRFADIRKDYKFENIEGLKVPGRDTDKGFAWSDNSTGGTTNGNRSLVYYYDATKGKSFNFNDVLKVLNLREGWTVNHTENPSFVATQGVNKAKAEGRQDGFSMSGTTFLKDGNYINVIDLVDRGSLSGGQNVSNSANKLVQQGKGGGTDTNLQNVTIAAANGLPGFTLNNVVNGEQAIHKAQVYLRPKYVNAGSLAERNGETKDTTTNVVNLYFVPIDPVKPVVEPSDSNELGASADNAPRLTDTSITASSLVKVTDNYDRDDLGTGATTSTTGTATPTTGTTLANEVRKRLNVWVKKDGVKTQVVENGVEKTTANGETVLGSLIKTVDPATYELVAQASDTSGNRSEEESLGFFKVGYNLNVRPIINFIQHEKLTDDDKRTLVRVDEGEGGQLEELPNGATVNVTFDTENVNGDYQEKRATATITFANGATTTKVIPYKVYKSFPMANKVYDFAGATKYRWYHDGDYYINNGLAQGLNWFAKREVEENGRTVLKDIPPLTQADKAKDDSIMARELNKDTAKGVGEYKYSYGATYPTGRYSATTTDELLKLRREGEIVHTVFDVGANTEKVTANSGDTLTADQAKAAVMPINGSKELPEGTTYEWVNSTVTGRGGTEVERQVRVTLVADPHGPYASNYPRVKTVTVKVKIEDVKPTVKIKFGNNDSVALTTNAEDNRFVIFKGATFNPTFIVDDNSGKTASINITGLPNGRSVKKTETMTNGTNVTVTDADAVTRDATTGTREASVTVADAAGNTETYKFKYTVEDAIPKEETKTVPLGTKLGTDSHDYVKLAVSTAPDRTVYPSGMTFKWKKDNVEVTRETAFSEPGRVTGYKAVVKFPTAGFYTINGVKTFVPESIERDVTFLVKPTKPTVTPEDNGNVTVTPANETNVNKVEVTYTPADNNRLEDNGDVTKTPQDRTTVIATKGTDNQWHITSGEKEGISVNPTTGEITLKDQVVKDQTKIQAKVIAQEVSSDENDTNNSKDGDRKIPTIDINNTLVEVGKEFSLPLGLSDGAGVGVDYTNIKVSSPNGETGLTYDATTKSIKGTINAATKKEITVRVLDKNGNKAEKTISIAAVKAKPIYAIKDGTIKNVDTPSNFVEMPAGLTASWKDDSRPTTAEAGNTKKTVTVSAEGYNAINVDIPVTIYPKVTLRKVGGNEVDTYHEIVGKPLTSTIVSGGDATDFYVEFEGGNKPDGTTITFKGGNPASPSTTAGTTTKTIVVTYPNGVGTFEKTVTFKTYGNEAKYEDGKDSVETIVGSAFAKTNASDYVKPSSTLANPDGTVIGWGNGYTPYNPVNKPQDKIGKREENVNVWYGNNVEKQRGDTQHWYSDQNIKVTLAVKPQAPTLTANQFQGKAGTKPEITVNNLPTTAQLTTGSTVKVQLKDATDTVVAEKTVVAGTESTTFTETDYNNPVTLGQQLTANVIVSGTYQKTEKTDNGTRQVQTAYSLVSNNSNSEQVTPQKPTFDTTTVTSTSRTLSGTLGGFNDPNRVVKVYLNDEKNTVLSSENNGEVTINNDGTWTATLPKNVKLRQSVAKNGETTMPPAITVENTVTGGTVSTRSDNKAVEMGDYSVASTVAGSKHIDITVPHDAKRVELRFHNNQETGDKPNSIVLVRGTDGWHTEATRTDSATVTNANGYVGTITSTPSTANPSENNIRIALNEQSGTAKLHIKEENANGDSTESYGSGLGIRVYNQPEAGQEPSATGKWKVASVTNTAPVLSHKGTDASSETNRKVYDSGTTITKEMLAELVTVTDPEDNAADANNKPYGSTTLEIVSGLTETPGQATPSGNYTVTLKATDSQGRKSNTLTVYVGVVSTDVKYQPQVNGVNVGNSKEIPIIGVTHQNGESITYTPIEKFTESGKQYVLKVKGTRTVQLTTEAQVINIEYVQDFTPVTPAKTPVANPAQ